MDVYEVDGSGKQKGELWRNVVRFDPSEKYGHVPDMSQRCVAIYGWVWGWGGWACVCVFCVLCCVCGPALPPRVRLRLPSAQAELVTPPPPKTTRVATRRPRPDDRTKPAGKQNSFSYEDVLLTPAADALEEALAGSSVDVEFSLSGEQGLSNFACATFLMRGRF